LIEATRGRPAACELPGSPAQIIMTQAIIPIEVNALRPPSRFDTDDGMKRV
jgi:hypothetical protein